MKTKWQLIYSFIKSNKLLVFIAFISGLFYNLFILLIPISLGRFYEFNFNFSSTRLRLINDLPFINSEHFTVFFWFFISLIALRFVFEFINRYYISIIGERFSKTLREQLFAHQLQIATSIYDQKGIGKYLLRYSGDLKSIQNYVARGLFRFTQDLILVAILITTICYIDFEIGALIFGFILISIFALFFINNVLYNISVSRRNQKSGMLTFVSTRLQAILSIKAFNKYTPEEKRYNKRSNNIYEISKKYQQTVSFIQSIIPALTYFMLAILMWYIYKLKTSNSTTFNQSSLLVLILLVIAFLPILRRVLRVSIVWKLGNISFQKLLQIFSLKKENTLPFETIDLSNKDIHFKNVNFSYSTSNSNVFENLNFTTPAKTTTLILGKSGSGKNTLIKLLLKLYQPTKGIILFGELNYNNLSEKSIRKNISVVSNTFPLYGKTVFEAITYSKKERQKPTITQLLDEIQQFEDSKNKLTLDSLIGDLGKNLTNGQKRILMYCRAFLTNKPILIIDRPFKDLNAKTIVHLTKKINALNGKKTIVILEQNQENNLKFDNYLEINNSSINNS